MPHVVQLKNNFKDMMNYTAGGHVRHTILQYDNKQQPLSHRVVQTVIMINVQTVLLLGCL